MEETDAGMRRRHDSLSIIDKVPLSIRADSGSYEDISALPRSPRSSWGGGGKEGSTGTPCQSTTTTDLKYVVLHRIND